MKSDVVLDVAESGTVFDAVVDVMEKEEWIMSGSGAGRGCAGSVVVFKAGAKTIGSRMCQFGGHSPVFENTLWIVVSFNV